MNKQLVVGLMTLSVAMAVYPLAGCGSSAGESSAQPGGEEQQSEAAATDEGQQSEAIPEEADAADDTLAEGPDVEGETEEQARILEREQLACDFVRTWGTGVTYDPEDDTAIEGIDDRLERTLAFVKPDSQLYADFLMANEYQGPGYFDAATVITFAEVVGHEGDTYTVSAGMAATQGLIPGWTESTYDREYEVTFDKDDYVVKFDEWG